MNWYKQAEEFFTGKYSIPGFNLDFIANHANYNKIIFPYSKSILQDGNPTPVLLSTLRGGNKTFIEKHEKVINDFIKPKKWDRIYVPANGMEIWLHKNMHQTGSWESLSKEMDKDYKSHLDKQNREDQKSFRERIDIITQQDNISYSDFSHVWQYGKKEDISMLMKKENLDIDIVIHFMQHTGLALYGSMSDRLRMLSNNFHKLPNDILNEYLNEMLYLKQEFYLEFTEQELTGILDIFINNKYQISTDGKNFRNLQTLVAYAYSFQTSSASSRSLISLLSIQDNPTEQCQAVVAHWGSLDDVLNLVDRGVFDSDDNSLYRLNTNFNTQEIISAIKIKKTNPKMYKNERMKNKNSDIDTLIPDTDYIN